MQLIKDKLKNIKIIKIKEKEIVLLKLKSFKDNRGEFIKIFSQNNMKFLGKNFNPKQINYVINRQRGVTRGLHFQIEKFAEKKVITCIKGEIQCVIVQMNKKSRNYLKYYSFLLSQKNQHILVVPKNYANGYQVLTKGSEVIYMSDNFYKKKYEKILNPDDPKIKINWKIKKKIQTNKDKFSKFIR